MATHTRPLTRSATRRIRGLSARHGVWRALRTLHASTGGVRYHRLMLTLLGGLWQLFRLAAISGFRLRGAYWTWRLHTAFGAGYPASTRELVKSMIEYGCWVHRMRR